MVAVQPYLLEKDNSTVKGAWPDGSDLFQLQHPVQVQLWVAELSHTGLRRQPEQWWQQEVLGVSPCSERIEFAPLPHSVLHGCLLRRLVSLLLFSCLTCRSLKGNSLIVSKSYPVEFKENLKKLKKLEKCTKNMQKRKTSSERRLWFIGSVSIEVLRD